MNSVIDNYQQLSNLTGQMRMAAMHGAWDQLVELEQQCSQYVALMQQQDLAPVDESVRLQKVALITKILADDAAIRDQTLPWMAQLQRKIQVTRKEQKVQQAYTVNY
jgi:flagellar protein FliT